ncbi:MAG: glycine zipper 2TM domain-containing protein [Thiothrix sp.]|nr:MAG: glycine zipper 2TM domain-containing protein [Thiothrix sp.]
MFKTTTKVAAIVLATSFALAGCNPPNNAQGGAMMGAVLGGVAGNQFGKGDGKIAATIAGTMLGSYIGGQIGASMDAYDQQQVGSAIYSGRPATWQNPNTGYTYTATPGNIYNSNYQGQQTACRPVTVVGYINGQQQNIQMNACRGANGQWQAVN